MVARSEIVRGGILNDYYLKCKAAVATSNMPPDRADEVRRFREALQPGDRATRITFHAKEPYVQEWVVLDVTRNAGRAIPQSVRAYKVGRSRMDAVSVSAFGLFPPEMSQAFKDLFAEYEKAAQTELLVREQQMVTEKRRVIAEINQHFRSGASIVVVTPANAPAANMATRVVYKPILADPRAVPDFPKNPVILAYVIME